MVTRFNEEILMSRLVPGTGPLHADLMIIGEAPGEEEEKQGLPFVGPSGRILINALKENGVHRDEVYITNVVKVRPPYNNLNLLGFPIESFLPQLYQEINSINPKCILLVGNTALKYLTGLVGVLKYRGSIVEVLNKYKAVICRHPADFFPKEGARQFDYSGEIILRNFDVKRAIEESKSRDIKLPLRNLWVCKNSLELLRFLDRIPIGSKLAIDIESHLAMPVCIALSFNPLEALSVKLLNFKQKSTLDQTQIWKFLIEFFHDRLDVKIVGQNFKFDQSRCNEFGIQIPNPYSDTMLKAHTCYSHLPKGLAFLTSVWTREPYYKDEGKEFDIKKHGIDRLLLYNAKDAAVTLEVDNVLEKELNELGLHDFYYDYIMRRHSFYYDIDSVGFKVDEDERQNLISKYWNFYEEKFKRNRILLGHGFNPNSPKQCEEVFYSELKIPKKERY